MAAAIPGMSSVGQEAPGAGAAERRRRAEALEGVLMVGLTIHEAGDIVDGELLFAGP